MNSAPITTIEIRTDGAVKFFFNNSLLQPTLVVTDLPAKVLVFLKSIAHLQRTTSKNLKFTIKEIADTVNSHSWYKDKVNTSDFKRDVKKALNDFARAKKKQKDARYSILKEHVVCGSRRAIEIQFTVTTLDPTFLEILTEQRLRGSTFEFTEEFINLTKTITDKTEQFHEDVNCQATHLDSLFELVKASYGMTEISELQLYLLFKQIFLVEISRLLLHPIVRGLLIQHLNWILSRNISVESPELSAQKKWLEVLFSCAGVIQTVENIRASYDSFDVQFRNMYAQSTATQRSFILIQYSKYWRHLEENKNFKNKSQSLIKSSCIGYDAIIGALYDQYGIARQRNKTLEVIDLIFELVTIKLVYAYEKNKALPDIVTMRNIYQKIIALLTSVVGYSRTNLISETAKKNIEMHALSKAMWAYTQLTVNADFSFENLCQKCQEILNLSSIPDLYILINDFFGNKNSIFLEIKIKVLLELLRFDIYFYREKLLFKDVVTKENMPLENDKNRLLQYKEYKNKSYKKNKSLGGFEQFRETIFRHYNCPKTYLLELYGKYGLASHIEVVERLLGKAEKTIRPPSRSGVV